MHTHLTVQQAGPRKETGEEQSENHGDGPEDDAQQMLLVPEDLTEATEESSQRHKHHCEAEDEGKGSEQGATRSPILTTGARRSNSSAEEGQIPGYQRQDAGRSERDQARHKGDRNCEQDRTLSHCRRGDSDHRSVDGSRQVTMPRA